jgi:alkanesulfonate monooxygenase SsuD/methylene tetrahydromethanopterin reductase-like flavin-dependent oxidoreductase (luciferase family)
MRVGTTGQQVLDSARRAEAASAFDGVCAGDHVTFHGYGNDGLVTLGAIAAVTERIGLNGGVPAAVAPPGARRAAVRANRPTQHGRSCSASASVAKTPRVRELRRRPRHRGARANEALQVLRRLWEEDHVTFSGRHFDLHDVTVYPKPLLPVPLFVGGRSDAALLRAGRYGDGYTGIWQSVERFVQAQEMIAEAALAAGRDPAAIEPGMQFWTSVGPGSEEARERVAEGMHATYRLPFERFERYTPFGTAAEVADFIAPYVEAGARHINLIHVQDTPEETVERAAESAKRCANSRRRPGLSTQDSGTRALSCRMVEVVDAHERNHSRQVRAPNHSGQVRAGFSSPLARETRS